MDLTALDIFRTVAAEGSVTRAAERLQRAQSNVTTRVRQLEADLGVALFLREGKRMALTPEGLVLQDYAQRLLALAEEARQALHPGQPAGRLRLGSMESTAASRLPAPLARLHGQWPDIALELCTGASQVLLDKLRAHALDAVLHQRGPEVEQKAQVHSFEPQIGEDLFGMDLGDLFHGFDFQNHPVSNDDVGPESFFEFQVLTLMPL